MKRSIIKYEFSFHLLVSCIPCIRLLFIQSAWAKKIMQQTRPHVISYIIYTVSDFWFDGASNRGKAEERGNRRNNLKQGRLCISSNDFHTKSYLFFDPNKLKSLKVAQLKDEMDGDEDDGCGSVCDVVMWCCVVMFCCEVVLWCCILMLFCVVMLCCDVVCEMLCVMVWVMWLMLVRWND